MVSQGSDRAIFFIGGNNWYHSLRKIGLDNIGQLNYARVCEKLAGPRTWDATRYYIPHIGVMGSPRLLAEQRNFLAQLQEQDPRKSVHFGRLEPRASESAAARELLRYLGELKVRIPTQVFRDLVSLGRAYAHTRVFVEKAVDVHIAVDMVSLAASDDYDSAYLLSADGDFTPAVDAVRKWGRRVFAVSPAPGAKLGAAVDSYVRLKREWFDGCFRR